MFDSPEKLQDFLMTPAVRREYTLLCFSEAMAEAQQTTGLTDQEIAEHMARFHVGSYSYHAATIPRVMDDPSNMRLTEFAAFMAACGAEVKIEIVFVATPMDKKKEQTNG